MSKWSPFRYFKTSPEIIRLAVMLYVCVALSLRNVEDLLHKRGVDVSHETVRFWWQRFGPRFAAVHASVSNHFNQERSVSSRHRFELNKTVALTEWRGLGAA